MGIEKLVKMKGYTFDDLLLLPQKSEVIPVDVNIKTKLTPNIELSIPIVSAAMDTVTESKLAIALARQGGIGFIHKNMSIEEQAKEVEMVKKNESGMIMDPITLTSDATLNEAETIMHQYRVSGLPIVDKDNKLLGIITNRDMKYLTLDDRKVSEFMTKENLITAKVKTTLEEAKMILWKNKIEKLLIVDEEYHLKGLITSKDIDNAVSFPNACKDKNGRLRVGAAVGVGTDLLARTKALINANVDVLVLDSAHGHSENVLKAIKTIKNNFPNVPLIAGNIVTAEAAKMLIDAGVDAVKVGVGPGSICTTRVIAGVGVPQLSAIFEVAEYAKKEGKCVIADGGIKYSGDITKALAAGADCVMLGGLFAGCKESPGEEIIYQGRRFKVYVGMGSIAAMKRGSASRYSQTSKDDVKKLVPEGIEGRVDYKGELADTVYQLCGGLKSGMGYCGAKNIKQLQATAQFVEITSAGLVENHPHDIEITKESPNYTK